MISNKINIGIGTEAQRTFYRDTKFHSSKCTSYANDTEKRQLLRYIYLAYLHS